MNRVTALAGLAVVALLPLGATADEQHIVAQANSIKWGPASPAVPKGAQVAVLFGDPTKEGPYVVRVKLPAGWKIPAHMHPMDEDITVMSGAVHLGTGDKLDETKGVALKAGDYFHMPKGMHHYVWFDEETTLQNNAIGPTGI